MSVLITGASGMIGRALMKRLHDEGMSPAPLIRCQPADAGSAPYWDPEGCRIDPGRFEGMDAVVHLAGENLSGKKWTPEQKKRIYESRIEGTRLIADSLAKMKKPPAVFLSASAVGFYGERGTEVLDESTGPGKGFVPELCRDWEEACAPAVDAGIRVATLRIGVVLGPGGGALEKMLPVFRLGLGGVHGGGNHFVSWISLDDVINAIIHCIKTDNVSGPVNLTAPNPVTNRDLTNTLARVLRRPALLPVPVFMMKAVFGQLADEVLLASARVMPQKLLDSGFEFSYPQLEPAIRSMIS